MERKDRLIHIISRIRGGAVPVRRGKYMAIWFITGLLCLVFCISARADGPGAVMDYMGKLRLEVFDQATDQPVAGAAVELYVPGLDCYVLFGRTDNDGVYELDAAYNIGMLVPDHEQFIQNDGGYMFTGTLVYLTDDTIQYRIRKADWSPDPYTGSKVLEGKTIPETVRIYLDQKKSAGEEGLSGQITTTGSKITQGSISVRDKLLSISEGALTMNMPEGIKDAVYYWACGLLSFLLAGGLICKMTNFNCRQKIDYRNRGRGRAG